MQGLLFRSQNAPPPTPTMATVAGGSGVRRKRGYNAGKTQQFASATMGCYSRDGEEIGLRFCS